MVGAMTGVAVASALAAVRESALPDAETTVIPPPVPPFAVLPTRLTLFRLSVLPVSMKKTPPRPPPPPLPAPPSVLKSV